MPNKLLLSLLLILLPLLSFSQGRLTKTNFRSPYTYIYKITNEETAEIYKQGPEVVSKSFFHTLVDSFAIRKSYSKELPQGHYLYMHASGPNLVYSLETVTNLQVNLLQTKPTLAVTVHDSAGKPVQSAKVRVNKRRANYDASTQTYRLSKTSKKGLLAVSVGAFTYYLELEKRETYSYHSSLSWPRKVLNSFPIKYIWRPINAVVQTIQHGQPEGWIRSVFAIFDEDYRRDKGYKYRGYLATNKPLYQPGDTVRYKAFVVKRNGKPLKEDLQLRLSHYRGGEKKLGQLEPYRKGAYEGSFILHDSLNLTLDYNYNLSLSRLNKQKQQVVRATIKYEDYELKENKYTLRLEHDKHYQGVQNQIYVRGTDANGLNLMDARVQLVVLANRVNKIKQQQVFIPDTLWVHEQPLYAMGETTIILPDTALPNAFVDYTVNANFLNSSNESNSKTKRASYLHTQGRLRFVLQQDSLLVEYLEGKESKPRTATVSAYSTDYEELLHQQIELPALVPLNAFAETYEVTSGELTEECDATEEKPSFQTYSERTADTLYFGLQNPQRLPYWYYVYRGEKLVARGQGKDATFAYQQKVRGEKPYFVAVRYVWGGTMQELKESAPHYKYTLNVAVEAPQVVYPGQEAELTVALTNAEGKPVANADLTAYAITSKFQNQNLPSLPSWNKFKGQKPYRELEIADADPRGSKLMDWDYWSRRMGLDSIACYNFLYPKQGIFTDYAYVKDSLTQVSPFVVDSGRVVPVHVVYLDEVPVYFSQTDVLPAYSFAADSGFHTLKLRTTDKLITLDSIYLRHGQKLVLSADITKPTDDAFKAEKKKFNLLEQQALSKYFFRVEQNYGTDYTYLKQGQRIHLLKPENNRRYGYQQRDYRYNSLLVGPFSPSFMQYHRLGRFTTNFLMEPGYTYLFEDGLLRQRQSLLGAGHLLSLPIWDKKPLGPELLRHEALTDARVTEAWEQAQYKSLFQNLYTSNSWSTPAGYGRLGWELDTSLRKQPELLLLIGEGRTDSLKIYNSSNRLLHRLEPHSYKLVLLFGDSTYVARKFTVQANGQTQLLFTAQELQQPDAQSLELQQIIRSRIEQQRKRVKNLDLEQMQQLRTAQATHYTYTSGSSYYAHVVRGQVTSKNDRDPLPGVSVVLKGTNIGTLTDMNGNYTINAPTNGMLVFSFIGFSAEEEAINGRDRINIKLPEDTQALQEVVVVGYGTQERREVTGSVATVLQGRAAGVQIRGVSTVADAAPLLIVDGVPFSGKMTDLDASNIASVKILKGAEATSLYGSAGAEGVTIITTKKAANNQLMAELPAGDNSGIRSNFSDYAFWQPRLVTDRNGKASFKTKFPDDVTSWNTYILGMDYKKRSGIFSTSIKSFKAMMATVSLPRFLIEGDQAQVIGKVMNYLPDSSQISTRFEVEGKQVRAQQQQLNRVSVDTLTITAPAMAPDSLEVLYALQQPNGFSDGERRFVKVYPKGVYETTGTFLQLHNDTTLTLSFDQQKGPVKMHVQGSLLDVMLDEIDKLHKYEYWCSEQAASKLKALLYEKRIREQLGQEFKHDRDVRKLVKHLEKTQLASGGWSWWERGNFYYWISSHVSEALQMARQENYGPKHNEEQLVKELVYRLESAAATDKLRALETLYALIANVDYKRYVLELEKWKKLTLEDQLRLTRLRQKLEMPVQLDTLQKYKRQTMLGGLYWGEQKYSLFNNSISNTLLAYDILKALGGHERELQQIQAYLLNERGSGYWRNTYESARILETLLPDLLTNEGELRGTKLQLAGAVAIEATNFPLDTTFMPSQALVVQKQGNQPLFFTAYQTEWVQAPQAVQNDFIVNTSFKGKGTEAALKAGEAVEMIVEVEVKADADYIMIEVPIPAGCSYEEKVGFRYGSAEVHREYFRHKVAIFSNSLKRGKYTYSIKLQPRYNGIYTLNPAKASLMYFPTFYGRTGLRQIKIAQ
ncbi:carboxypeptidase-like regulatory domain-containing protein [Pontibacter harenae]|uniref:carboxypeptidase-like regulatory domain-containing protein n=1 Tax=Pontibacter harenae TaxID=2894083 RepID=UPI001E5B67D3|nr:carboxypeptidase-like regulatory domain-containing protein [Pontibacter harenae]MCC9167503.1 carboxypeptidase-like regulatory domain-containing protein [Pontibacter harenae]